MANVIEQLQDWLLQNRPFRMDWLEKDVAYLSKVEDSLAELPTDIAQQLIKLVKKLPSHPHDQKVIQEAVSTAVMQWQQAPDPVSNSIVFLSSPVSAVARILIEGLADWAEQNSLRLNLLDWIERPENPAQIQSKICETLGNVESDSERKNISVIPNLSWCFLRSTEGLDGIDYLRDRLLSDRTQFWIIGSGQVGWQYLNSILRLQAHCGEIIQLPSLSGQQLQDWLMPIIDQLDIKFDKIPIQQRLQALGEEKSKSSSFGILTAVLEELNAVVRSLLRIIKQEARLSESKENEAKDDGLKWEDYFEHLSHLSEGVSTTALQLFIKSIHYEVIEENSDQKLVNEAPTEEVETLLGPETSFPLHRLVARMPRLPTLPELEQNDLYILYSMLVHGSVTLDALAESLGEELQIVNDHIQILRKVGLIEKQGQTIKVNPVNYPRLKKRLAGDNFIVKVAD